MAGPIGNPELLAECRRGVNHKFLFGLVVRRRRLHLGSIVAVAKFGEAEAAHVLERVDFTHHGQVTLSVESHEGAAKEVELDGELGGEVSVDLSEHLVGGEDVLRVVLEVKD